MDFRKNKKIGTAKKSDIKCSSITQINKVITANIYPTPGDEVHYWNDYLEMYCIGTVIKYKTPLTIIIDDDFNEFIFTLKKDGKWTVKKGSFDNIFDVKFMKELKEI